MKQADRDEGRQLGWQFIGIGPDVDHSTRFDGFLDHESVWKALATASYYGSTRFVAAR